MGKYILLGIIQGLTEFFPVSSSAHLLIVQKLLGVSTNAVALSVVLHLGTALALIVFFFKDILNALRNRKMLWLIIIVTLITGIIGISGKAFFESLFNSMRIIPLALMFTGIVLILIRKFIDGNRQSLSAKDAVALGIAQGIAIVPGISRSGMTISTLLLRGVERKVSFNFSFLASIPAVLGAAILEAKDIGSALRIDSTNLIIGFAFSFFSGLIALWILKLVINKAKLHYFGYYCFFIAFITLLFK